MCSRRLAGGQVATASLVADALTSPALPMSPGDVPSREVTAPVAQEADHSPASDQDSLACSATCSAVHDSRDREPTASMRGRIGNSRASCCLESGTPRRSHDVRRGRRCWPSPSQVTMGYRHNAAVGVNDVQGLGTRRMCRALPSLASLPYRRNVPGETSPVQRTDLYLALGKVVVAWGQLEATVRKFRRQHDARGRPKLAPAPAAGGRTLRCTDGGPLCQVGLAGAWRDAAR